MCPSGSSTANLLLKPTKTPKLRPAFDVLDRDGDGKISRDDLQSFYSGFLSDSSSITEDDMIGSMISAADFNKDGYVEYEEFEKVLSGRTERRRDGGVMEEVFKVMDRDGDEKVSCEDLKIYLNGAGVPASDEDIIAMVRLGGGDQSRGVTFDGLLKILSVNLTI